MVENLARAGSVIMAESVMLALVSKGMGRQEAHELIRKCSMDAQRAGTDFKADLMANKSVAALLSEEEVVNALDPRAYLGTAGHTVDSILRTVA
jgi:adenylosuccinate lyase